MRLLPLICLFLYAAGLLGHQEPDRILMQEDSLNVEVSDNRQYYFLHRMAPKQTLYSTARLYGVSLEDIYQNNPELTERIVREGETISIPMDEWKVDPQAKHGPKVYYTIKPKETLFRVARIYFDMTIDQIKALNAMDGNELDIGQALQIGRLVPAKRAVDSTSFSLDSTSLSESLPDFTGQSWVEDKSIAYWLKNANPDHTHVVLHNEAPVNSWVAITNPMYGKTVAAKVIGRIPNKVYPSDIDVILSYGVAQSLGAIDARFYVKLKHLRQPQP